MPIARWAFHSDRTAEAPSRPAAIESIGSAREATASPTVAPRISSSTNDSAVTLSTFRGRVIDALTRQGVRVFEVQLQGTQPKTTGDSTPRARRFRSVDGRFEWQHLPAGEWTVIARALGYQRFEFDKLQLRSGFLTREIVLPLRRGHRLGGRIYDEESGAGIGGASIELREAGSGRFDRNWRTRARATSATDGTFVLDGLPAGPLTLDIYAKDHAGRELDVMVREQTPPVEISLSAGGAVSGYLTAADHITRITGSTRLFSLEQPFGRISRTGDEGEFSFEHLPPGK